MLIWIASCGRCLRRFICCWCCCGLLLGSRSRSRGCRGWCCWSGGRADDPQGWRRVRGWRVCCLSESLLLSLESRDRGHTSRRSIVVMVYSNFRPGSSSSSRENDGSRRWGESSSSNNISHPSCPGCGWWWTHRLSLHKSRQSPSCYFRCCPWRALCRSRVRESNKFLDQLSEIHVHALLTDDTFGVKHPKVAIVGGLETLLTGLSDVVSYHVSAHPAGDVADLALAVRCCVVLID